MKYALLAGGPPDFWPEGLEETPDIQWIGIDRGTYYLLKKGIRPVRAFGDFDSVTDNERKWLEENRVQFSMFDKEKDQTDTELALNWAIEQRPEIIYIFGATGGRLDHGLMNIHLLTKGLESRIPIHIVDKQNWICANPKGSYKLAKNERYPYLSFLPFTQMVKGLTIKGVKYPLDDTTLPFGTSLCISNEIVNDFASYSFDEGTILIIRSRD